MIILLKIQRLEGKQKLVDPDEIIMCRLIWINSVYKQIQLLL